MQFLEIVAILRQDNPDADRALLTSAADWLLVWSRASRDVRERGPLVWTESGKQVKNPMMSSKSDAERALFGSKSNFANIYLSGAVKAMEESDGVEKQNDPASRCGDGSSTVNADPPDLPTGGVEPALDRGSTVVRCDKRALPRKGRKPGSSKLPAHLRA